MDLATIGGFLFAVAMIVVGAAVEHVTLNSMIGPSAFLIVIGGTVGASIVSHTMEELRYVPRALKLALFPPRRDYAGMIDELTNLADKARRHGLLALQENSESATMPLLKQGLTMIVDGADPDMAQEVLESMADMEAGVIKQAGAIFETAGGYAPTLGILGTVMGLVTIMGQLSEPDTLGPLIAVAFLATLYGVGFANLLFLPLGAKVKAAANQQSKFDEMIITGLVGIQSGENPRILRERLLIYTGGRVPRSAISAGAIDSARASTVQEGA